MMSHFHRPLEFYQAGSLPWDQVDPPPEVLTFMPTLPVGRALDLGCGLERVEYGQTQGGDQPPWRSAWFWFRRG